MIGIEKIEECEMSRKNLVFMIFVILFVVSLSSPSYAGNKVKVKEFSLVAKESSWELLPGVKVKAMTLNGVIPGPEIRVREGDTVRIKVRNELKEPTALHWHGLEVPYDMDGVPGITQDPIDPEQEFTYEFVAKPAGVRFYHAHSNEAVQMTNAMHGAFVIEPAWDAQNRPDRHYILFLTEWTVNTASSESMSGMDSNYFTINGKAFPVTEKLAVKKGEKIRLTLIHMGTSYHPMHLHGHQFRIVAKDGNEVPRSLQETRNVIPMLPGESYDIEFIANNPGVWAFHCHEPHHVMNNKVEPGGLIALVVYEGYESIAAKAQQLIPVDKMEQMGDM